MAEQDPELMSVADRIAAAHALDCPAGTRRWYWPRDIETRPCTCGAEERGRRECDGGDPDWEATDGEQAC